MHDAAQWRMLFGSGLPLKLRSVRRPQQPASPAVQHIAELEHSPGGMDEYRFEMQTLREWTNQWFEHEAIRLFLGAFSLHANVAPDQAGGGQLAWLFDSVIQDYGNKR